MIITGDMSKEDVKDSNLPMFSRTGRGTNNMYKVFQRQQKSQLKNPEVSEDDKSDSSSQSEQQEKRHKKDPRHTLDC